MSDATQHQKSFRQYCKVLTIAGSDSGGGAGIQADLKTFSAIGCYGMSVITALTAQNTRGVKGIHAVPPVFAVQQIEAVFSDMGADAVKIGMLYSAELIEAVAAALKKHNAQKIVLDPVMVAQSGDKLLQDDAIEAVKTHLMPLADVVTPNIPEASVLCGRPLKQWSDIESAAKTLAQHGSRSILILCQSGRRPHRDQQQPRNRLHAVIGDCQLYGQGQGYRGSCSKGQNIYEPGHRRRRSL
jgi:hydroxymethylpyrimidine/phosphomethylpyrimidine kinase